MLEGRTLLSAVLDTGDAFVGSGTDYGMGAQAVAQEIVKARSWTVLALSTTAATYGQSVLLLATVTAKIGKPTGTVMFYDGQRLIGQGAVNTRGEARLTVNNLSVGYHNIKAAFGGDGQRQASVSKAVWLNVTQAPTKTTLLMQTPTVTQGQEASLVVSTLFSKGRVAAYPNGMVLLKDGQRVVGTVSLDGRTPQATFDTDTLAPGAHSITAVYTGSADIAASVSKPVTLTVLASTTVDLLVVYTPQARNAAGGTNAIAGQIRSAVASTNQAFVNSRIAASIRLVGAEEVAYNESRALETDLERLRNRSDGYMDSVHSLRDKYGADLVSLFVSDGDYAGLGYKLISANDPGRAELGYTVVLAPYAGAPEYVLAHELGHNFGATHDRENSEGPGFASYAYGYRFTVGNTTYRDIMSYDPGVLIPYFSNPDVTYAGVPTGSSTANVARVINQTARIVANYRKAVTTSIRTTTTTLAASRASSVAGQNVTFTATVRSGSSSINGSVLFLDGNNAIKLVPVKGGIATLTTKSLAAGTHSITALFIGSDSFSLSSSTPLKYQVAAKTLA